MRKPRAAIPGIRARTRKQTENQPTIRRDDHQCAADKPWPRTQSLDGQQHSGVVVHQMAELVRHHRLHLLARQGEIDEAPGDDDVSRRRAEPERKRIWSRAIEQPEAGRRLARHLGHPLEGIQRRPLEHLAQAQAGGSRFG